MTSRIPVLVPGGSGMLGSMVADVLARDPAFEVTATVRSEDLRRALGAAIPDATWRVVTSLDACADAVDGHLWVVNAIGLTKPQIREDVAADVLQALEINARLPHLIGARAEAAGARVLHIATDAVFSPAAEGPLVETTAHDPRDVYGKTKSLGETRRHGFHSLRCSIIGPEPRNFRFLLEWFRRQPPGADVKGFAHHTWNGVTTLHFARVCAGIIKTGLPLPDVQHLVPSGISTKAAMLRAFARAFNRQDITVVDVTNGPAVDRRLQTLNPEVNAALWAAAGYAAPPTVEAMIQELADFDYRAALPA
jgi:dTDP-4-dehydrorhamnose reductase